MKRAEGERFLETAVVLAALASVPLTIAQAEGVHGVVVDAADWAIWGVFLVEYVALLAVAADRRAYVRRNWLSLAVVVLTFPAAPHLLALLRVARLVRWLRLIRLAMFTAGGLRALSAALGRHGLRYVGGVTSLLLVAGAGAMVLVEPETVEGDFWSGLWWATVTATTVGYGDISPATVPGRLIAVVLMLTGIGLVSTLAAAITAAFVSQDQEQRSELVEIGARLERIEALLRSQALLDGAERSAGSSTPSDAASAQR